MALVLEQHDALFGRFKRYLARSLIVERNLQISLVMVEETEFNRHAQDTPHLVIDRCQSDFAGLDRLQQRLGVHKSCKGHFEIKASVGGGDAVISGTPVGHQDAAKSPLLL